MRRIAEVFKHVESFDGLDGLSWLAEARCMHIVSRYARCIKAVINHGFSFGHSQSLTRLTSSSLVTHQTLPGYPKVCCVVPRQALGGLSMAKSEYGGMLSVWLRGIKGKPVASQSLCSIQDAFIPTACVIISPARVE